MHLHRLNPKRKKQFLKQETQFTKSVQRPKTSCVKDAPRFRSRNAAICSVKSCSTKKLTTSTRRTKFSTAKSRQLTQSSKKLRLSSAASLKCLKEFQTSPRTRQEITFSSHLRKTSPEKRHTRYSNLSRSCVTSPTIWHVKSFPQQSSAAPQSRLPRLQFPLLPCPTTK